MSAAGSEATAVEPTRRQWRCRAWPDGCRRCGRPDRKHHGQGFCTGCYRSAAAEGLLVTQPRTGKLRLRNGLRERYCHSEQLWQPEANFRKMRRGEAFTYEIVCITCSSRRRKESYQRRRAEIRARNRARWRQLHEATKAADRREPSARIRVPAQEIARWLSEWTATHNGRAGQSRSLAEVASAARIHERTLRRVLAGEVTDVAFDLADRIAGHTGHHEEASRFLRLGMPGWSKHSDYCRRCGRFDRPHYTSGYCLPCYATIGWHRRHGKPAPPPHDQRWTIQAPAGCKKCQSTKNPHVARGLCRRCYGKYARWAKAAEMDIRDVLDRAGFPRAINNPVFDRVAIAQ